MFTLRKCGKTLNVYAQDTTKCLEFGLAKLRVFVCDLGDGTVSLAQLDCELTVTNRSY